VAFEEIFLLVGIAGVLIAVFVPFVMRGLNKGEKQVITTNNYYNLAHNVTSLETKVEKGLEEAKQERREMKETHQRDMDQVNKTFSQVGGDIRIHTGQIASFCIDITKIEDRLRRAEGEIIRNEKSRVHMSDE
jgi:hypothetical protein